MTSGSLSITGKIPKKELLEKIVTSATDAVTPRVLFEEGFRVIGDNLTSFGREIDLSQFENIRCVAIGKCAEAMAFEVEKKLGERMSGIIATPLAKHLTGKRCRFFKTGHPLPDEESLKAASEICSFVSSCGDGDILIFLISGGGSAAAFLPVEGVSLDEMNETLKVLFDSGFSIDKINLVRRHLSSLGGGKLAGLSPRSEKISLIISDVVGDDLPSIASGPTVLDMTTPGDAYNFLEATGLIYTLPHSISVVLAKLRDTFSGVDLKNDYARIVGSNIDALNAAGKTGNEHRYNPLVLTRTLALSTERAADLLVSVAQTVGLDGKSLPAMILLGGETTVKITGTGVGGRNQQLVLQALLKLVQLAAKEPFLNRVTIFSFGTDGKDGNSDAAGACCSTALMKSVGGGTEEIEKYISQNDSNSFFKKNGGLITTGPTDTNVMDIMGIIVE